MYITGFLIIFIQSSCIGMDWSRKLQSSPTTNPIPNSIPIPYFHQGMNDMGGSMG